MSRAADIERARQAHCEPEENHADPVPPDFGPLDDEYNWLGGPCDHESAVHNGEPDEMTEDECREDAA